MTTEERLSEFQDWLLKEYNATFDLWLEASAPVFRSITFTCLQVLARTAVHLRFGRDEVVPISTPDEYLARFVRHLRPRQN